jgi:hypothetical protein
MKITSAAEAYSASPFLKVLLTGPSGAGKSTWSARSPRPLILLTEAQGLASIRAANPAAQVVLVESWDEFASAMSAIKRGTRVSVDGGEAALRLDDPAGTVVQTLVLDSLTDVCRLLVDKMAGDGAAERLDRPDEGLADVSIQQWGRVKDTLLYLLRVLRELPCNVVALAIAHEELDANQRRTIKPSVQPKSLGDAVGQFFSASGYIRIGMTGHEIVWQMPGAPTKRAPGWPTRVTLSADNPADCSFGSLALLSNPANETPRSDGDNAEYARVHVTTPAAVTTTPPRPAPAPRPNPEEKNLRPASGRQMGRR